MKNILLRLKYKCESGSPEKIKKFTIVCSICEILSNIAMILVFVRSKFPQINWYSGLPEKIY